MKLQLINILTNLRLKKISYEWRVYIILLAIFAFASCTTASGLRTSNIPYPKRIGNGELISSGKYLKLSPQLYNTYPTKTKLIAQRIRFPASANVQKRELNHLIGAIDFLLQEFFIPINPPKVITISVAASLTHRPQTEISTSNTSVVNIAPADLSASRVEILVHELFHALYLSKGSSIFPRLHEAWATYAQLLYRHRNIGDNLRIADKIAPQHQISLDKYLTSPKFNLWEDSNFILTSDEDYIHYAFPLLLFDKVSNLDNVLRYHAGMQHKIPNIIEMCGDYFSFGGISKNKVALLEKKCAAFATTTNATNATNPLNK